MARKPLHAQGRIPLISSPADYELLALNPRWPGSSVSALADIDGSESTSGVMNRASEGFNTGIRRAVVAKLPQ